MVELLASETQDRTRLQTVRRTPEEELSALTGEIEEQIEARRPAASSSTAFPSRGSSARRCCASAAPSSG